MIRFLILPVLLFVFTNLRAQRESERQQCKELIGESRQLIGTLNTCYSTKKELAGKIAPGEISLSDSVETFLLNVGKLNRLHGNNRLYRYMFESCDFENKLSPQYQTGIEKTLLMCDSTTLELQRIFKAYGQLNSNVEDNNLAGYAKMIDAADRFLDRKKEYDSIDYYLGTLQNIHTQLNKDLKTFNAAKTIAGSFAVLYPKLLDDFQLLAKTHYAAVARELENEKKKFAEKGPEGFSEAYFDVFQDIHHEGRVFSEPPMPPPPPPAKK